MTIPVITLQVYPSNQLTKGQTIHNSINKTYKHIRYAMFIKDRVNSMNINVYERLYCEKQRSLKRKSFLL